MTLQVLAFSNLTMDELKSAVDTFCAFIDRNTYALFYYNGHAIGHGNDVYLVSKDTDFKEVCILIAANWFLYLGCLIIMNTFIILNLE